MKIKGEIIKSEIENIIHSVASKANFVHIRTCPKCDNWLEPFEIRDRGEVEENIVLCRRCAPEELTDRYAHNKFWERHKEADLARVKNMTQKQKTFSKTFSIGSGDLVIHGKTGVGKSDLAFAIAKNCIKKYLEKQFQSKGISGDEEFDSYVIRYPNILFIEYYSMIDSVKKLFKRDDEFDILKTRVNLFVIDGLGETSREDAREFEMIMNYLYNNSFQYIITTNLTKPQINEQYGNRVAGRMRQTAHFLEMKGVDHRCEKKT